MDKFMQLYEEFLQHSDALLHRISTVLDEQRVLRQCQVETRQWITRTTARIEALLDEAGEV